VTLLRAEAAAGFRAGIAQAYQQQWGVTPRIYSCEPSDGAAEVLNLRRSPGRLTNFQRQRRMSSMAGQSDLNALPMNYLSSCSSVLSVVAGRHTAGPVNVIAFAAFPNTSRRRFSHSVF